MKKESSHFSPFGREFWLAKGLTIEQADFERNSRRPICKEYWIKKGYTENESIEKAIETKTNNNKNGSIKSKNRSKIEIRESSKRCIEYWIKRCPTIEEAKQGLAKYQTNFSLDVCIEKYGDIEGMRRWKERQDNWQKSIKKTIEQNPNINKLKNCMDYKRLTIIYSREEIKENMEKRGIYLYDTKGQLEDYINNLFLDRPELYYTNVKTFMSICKISKLHLDFAGVDDPSFISSKLIKRGVTYRDGMNYICMKTNKGLLKSSYEIYFYNLLGKYDITEFDVGKRYPNSSFRYDFYIPQFDLYIEICPLYNKNEKYTIKMNKKKQLFGCVLLQDTRQFEVFINGLLDENNNRKSL